MLSKSEIECNIKRPPMWFIVSMYVLASMIEVMNHWWNQKYNRPSHILQEMRIVHYKHIAVQYHIQVFFTNNTYQYVSNRLWTAIPGSKYHSQLQGNRIWFEGELQMSAWSPVREWESGEDLQLAGRMGGGTGGVLMWGRIISTLWASPIVSNTAKHCISESRLSSDKLFYHHVMT